MNKLLHKILIQSDNHVFTAMRKKLSQYGNIKTDGENFIYLKRDNSKICLVAHVDTVCDCGFKRITERSGIIRNLNGILGADDRAGIYAIVKLLNLNIPFDVIITNYEETGALGAKAFVESDLFDPAQLELIIQLDRRGENDYVTYNQIAPEISDYVESFWFKENMGTFSDITVIAPPYGLNAVNISIGYLSEHTPKETLNILWLKNTIKKVESMIKNPPGEIYPLPVESNCFKGGGFSDIFCQKCGEPLTPEDIDFGDCPWCGSLLYDDIDDDFQDWLLEQKNCTVDMN